MSAHTWPPPADESTVWRRYRLSDVTGASPPLRRVRLWGNVVEVDADGLIWCAGCEELLTPQQLQEPNNGHVPAPAFTRGVMVGTVDYGDPQ